MFHLPLCMPFSRGMWPKDSFYLLSTGVIKIKGVAIKKKRGREIYCIFLSELCFSLRLDFLRQVKGGSLSCLKMRHLPLYFQLFKKTHTGIGLSLVSVRTLRRESVQI